MMLLWAIIVLMLAVTLAAILFPLFRGRDTLETRDVFDANIYKDQLKAIDRELDEGQIEDEDAQSARIEISRKLLAAADKAEKRPSLKAQGRQLSKLTAIGIALAIPLLAVGFYLKVGSPRLDDMPLQARLKTPPQQENIASLMARAEQRLMQNPGDGRGWEIMAPVFLRREMYGKAENAYNNAIKLLGPSADRLSGLSDAIILANNNIVADKVVPILKRAIKADPNHPKPHFWMGMYHEQHNKFKRAEKLYTELLQRSGAKETWRPMVEARLNDVRGKQGLPPVKIAGKKATSPPEIKLGDALKASEKPGKELLKAPTKEDVERASQMSAADRNDMVNSMVTGLAERLYDEGGDVKSWLRLVNVYNVLGKKTEARKAVQAARKNLHKNQGDIVQIEALAKRLGLGS